MKNGDNHRRADITGRLISNVMSLRRVKRNGRRPIYRSAASLVAQSLTLVLALSSCAKMGNPDGGWYDETPPRITACVPNDKATGVRTRKVSIHFNEYIQVDNPSEKVVVSPPQMEMPEIKAGGKKITVELKDSLRQNTTYTIDFSDAISDNNEGNPLGNFTYSFSTGERIDTLEVSGYVIDAQNFEPIKGMLVGLYSNLNDTAFTTQPMLRVSRTDSRGHFIIKGVAPGSYRVYALEDADGDYRFSQKSERIAFNRDVITPYCMPDIRQDTVWRDSLRIDSIKPVKYTHFFPDNIVMLAFTEKQTDRYLIKSERKEADRFTLFFSYGDEELPYVRGLNFNERDAFITEHSERRDTITYWLKDTALVNRDTLRVELKYMATDSAGVLRQQTDTLDILSRDTYEKRMKRLAAQREEWEKQQQKAKKRGKEYQTVMPEPALEPQFVLPSEPSPDFNVIVRMPSPLQVADTSRIHLYSKHDSLWYRSPFVFREKAGANRVYELLGEWRPGIEYSLEVDTMAFTDIYGKVSSPMKRGFRIKGEDAFASILFDMPGMEDSTVVVQLLNGSDNVLKEVVADKGKAEFFYITPGVYYARMFIDTNRNGKWDTGDYAAGKQAETTCYYPEKIECRAKWDLTLTWRPMEKRADRQKPLSITKQKPETEKTIKRRNAERAKDLGVQAPR